MVSVATVSTVQFPDAVEERIPIAYPYFGTVVPRLISRVVPDEAAEVEHKSPAATVVDAAVLFASDLVQSVGELFSL
jgi:hypothetical protein